MYTVYGIPNCNSVKKARAWLEERGLAYAFHDYKKQGIAQGKLEEWCRQKGWDALVNRKGTTWRQLEAPVRDAVVNEAAAVNLMLDKHSVIKRPLIEQDGRVVALGFDEEGYKAFFGS